MAFAYKFDINNNFKHINGDSMKLIFTILATFSIASVPFTSKAQNSNNELRLFAALTSAEVIELKKTLKVSNLLVATINNEESSVVLTYGGSNIICNITTVIGLEQAPQIGGSESINFKNVVTEVSHSCEEEVSKDK